MLKKIASGAYGNVFVNKKNVVKKMKTKNEMGRKINVSGEMAHECAIARKIKRFDPMHVIRIKNCSSKTMRMNYHRMGTVEMWLIKKPPSLTDASLMRVIKQVLRTLAKIYRNDPSFRHNDLHGGNILLNSRMSPVISDFGLACDNQYKNKLLTPWIAKETGAYPGSHYMYDAHTFLNFVYVYIRSLSLQKRLPKTFAYLKKFLGTRFAGEKGLYLKGMRLRTGVRFPYTYTDLIGTKRKTVVSTAAKSNEAWKKAQAMLRNVATVKKM